MKLNINLITRNLINGKGYTALNIIGLAIGFTCAFVMMGWVKNEFSYDKQLPHSGRIYRLTFETRFSGNRLHFARCWEKWISQMTGDFPQIEELVRLEPYRHTALKVGENKFYSDRVFATDSNFFKVFGLDLAYGDVEKVLKDPSSAVISLSLARKCFGDTNPVNQTLLMSGEYDEKMVLFTITGVMKDSPYNSHIHFDVLTSFAKPQDVPGWAYIYLLLKQGTNPDEILAGLPSFIKKVEKEHVQNDFTPYLQKITDIHLFSNKDREVEPNSNIISVYLFVVTSLILLIVSWVNYYNLSKARILALQKPIHIQLIMGSSNWLVIAQNLIESAIYVLLAFMLTMILLYLFGQIANTLFGFSILKNWFTDIVNLWPFVTSVLAISVFTGSLPVILYILKGRKSLSGFKEIPKLTAPRLSSYGILMTLQFCLSIVLMVATIIIYRQKELILAHSLGKMSSDILVFKRQNWEIRYKYNSFRNKALQNPLIKNVSASMEEPTGETVDALKVESAALDEDLKDKQLYVLSVEDNFLTFFDISLVAGRNFSPYNPDRQGEDYILNESAIKELNWTPQEAIGRPFKIIFDSPGIFYGGTVVGVVHDFNFTTIKQNIKPYVLFQKPIFYLCFLVQVDPARKQEAIMSLKNIWEQELPNYPFQYEFLYDLYNSAYQKEFNQAKLTTFFSILTIVVICLGLFSVTSVLVAQRTKEIGIRKVNGAKVIDVMVMLNSDFIIWFAIAFLIACPIAWYAMHRWLQSFAYKTELSWWIFALAGIIALGIALLTVSWQSWKAATSNPVEALRYE